MISAKNILAHEWIGLSIKVEKSADPKATGIAGLVRDETRNTLTIETGTRTVRIAKLHTTFQTTLPSGEKVVVSGSDLRYRPEDRIKKGLGKW